MTGYPYGVDVDAARKAMEAAGGWSAPPLEEAPDGPPRGAQAASLAEPFDVDALLAKIEQMLAEQERRADARAEEASRQAAAVLAQAAALIRESADIRQALEAPPGPETPTPLDAHEEAERKRRLSRALAAAAVGLVALGLVMLGLSAGLPIILGN